MQVGQAQVLSNLSNVLPLWQVANSSSKQLFKSKRPRRVVAEKERKMERRVYFLLDQDQGNAIQAETCPQHDSDSRSSDVHQLSQEDIQALWWSSEELQEIQQSAMSLCLDLMKNQQEYCRAAATLVGICARSDAADYSLSPTDCVLTCQQHGAARGLTAHFVPTLPQRRMRSVQLALKTQAETRNKVVNWDRMLAAKYQYLSRYAVIWARVLAEQDAACCYE